MGVRFIHKQDSNISFDTELDEMKRKLQKKISQKIQSNINLEVEENFLLNLVFQHLTPNELITGSLVSKNWYQQIGKLKTFSERMTIKFGTENLQVGLDSERYYEKIELTIRNTPQEIIDAERIILKYLPNLTSLKIIKYGGFNSMLNEPLPFSENLKEVELHAICGRLSGEFLRYITSLEKLTVNGLDPQELLCCFTKNLKELILYENSFISYFENDISSSVDFQLKKFAILDNFNCKYKLNGEFEARKWNKVMLKNMKKFLMTQHQLKYLQLGHCHTSNLRKFIRPSIEVLEIRNIEGDLDKLNVPSKNNNVRVLLTKFSTVELFAQFPKLESIYVKHLSSDMLTIKCQNYNIQNIHYEMQEDDTLFWINCSVIIEQLSLKEFRKIYCTFE